MCEDETIIIITNFEQIPSLTNSSLRVSLKLLLTSLDDDPRVIFIFQCHDNNIE